MHHSSIEPLTVEDFEKQHGREKPRHEYEENRQARRARIAKERKLASIAIKSKETV